ncbi:MAG: twin-arginine translocation signal domain-containing protein, partial [Woeseiaceae bacterium]
MAGNQTNDSLSRREFIKSVSLAGASMAVSASAGSAMVRTEKDARIGNEHFVVSFDSNQG